MSYKIISGPCTLLLEHESFDILCDTDWSHKISFAWAASKAIYDQKNDDVVSIEVDPYLFKLIIEQLI
jgi:hypothetical protein